MHTRPRQLWTALALVLATVSASALAAPAAPRGTAAVSSASPHVRFAPAQAPARLNKRRGPVLTSAGTAATTYSVSPGVSVQRGAENGGSGSSAQSAVSPGVTVEKLTAAGGGSASVTALSAGVSIEKLAAGGIGGVGSAAYIVSPGVSVQKLSASDGGGGGGGGGGNYFQFVVSPGVSVQRSPVGGNTLTTLIAGGPAEGATLCDSSPQFTFSASSTDPSASFVFVYRVDGGQWQGPIKETHAALGPLSDGPHLFEVAAIDELGNEDPNPAARHFTVDTLPPAILQLTAKPGVTSAVVTWTTDKPATSQVEYQAPGTSVWLKSALDSALVTAHSVTLTGLTPAASYTYRARSADSCGQETISDPLIFVTAQDTPPTTTITGGPAEGTVVCDSTVTFDFIGNDASTPVNKLRYEYRLDGSSWSAPALATTALLSGLTDGPHTFEVAAVNESGSADPHPAVRRFVVSARAPIVTDIRSAARDYRATITWTTNKATSSQVEYGPNADYRYATTLDSALVTAHTVTLTGLIPLTAYHFRVKSSNGCHEAVSSDQALTTTDILRPDLEVTSLTFPATVKAHDQITVSWNVQNNGLGDAALAWNDGVYLSPTLTLDPKMAILLGKFSAGLALGVGASYTQNQTLALPGLSAGRYYLIIAADSDNAVQHNPYALERLLHHQQT